MSVGYKKQKQYSVAVVDNDLSILDSIKMILEDQGWEIYLYHSGRHFFSDTAQKGFDCVLFDPNLPGIDGTDIVQRATEYNQKVRVVILTARPYGENFFSLLNSGINDFLVKPVSESELVHTIRRVLEASTDHFH